VYGWPAIGLGSPLDLVEHIHNHGDVLARAALPGAHLVDLIPIMKYLPTWIAPWKRRGQESYSRETALFESFITDIAAEMVNTNILDTV
jgi:hypothetical protein